MAVTNEQVRAVLDLDEPDYERAAAEFDRDAIPILRRFVEGGDPNLAAKAAYLAGRMGDVEAVPILELAADSTDPGVRAAAASGARHIGSAAEPVLLTLLDDDDPAVRKTAVRATPPNPGAELLAKLQVLRDVEPVSMVREVAADVVDNVSGGDALQ
jgi:HEAT repeat protein